MNDKEYEKFFELLNKITNGKDLWQERKAQLDEQASDSDMMNLSELVGWYASESE